MDTVETYRQIIKKLFDEYAGIPYSYGNVWKEVIFDCENDRYLLMALGWDGAKRVHGCVFHIDIIDEKLWIQRDGTDFGIAGDLLESGVPKDHIVLGFRKPEIRQYTEFAVA